MIPCKSQDVREAQTSLIRLSSATHEVGFVFLQQPYIAMQWYAPEGVWQLDILRKDSSNRVTFVYDEVCPTDAAILDRHGIRYRMSATGQGEAVPDPVVLGPTTVNGATGVLVECAEQYFEKSTGLQITFLRFIR